MLKYLSITICVIALAGVAHAAEIQRGNGNASHLPIIKASESEDLRRTRVLAEQGDAVAQNNLGVMYERGRGVAQDPAEAMRWYRLAAAQGFARAQTRLGVRYAYGLGVAQDHAEAVRWYRLAAAQGDADAQTNLGFMYARGQGIAQDHAEAVRWYRLAAAQGDAWAQNRLGFMYSEGQGVAQDHAEAVRWYRLAAEQGFGHASEALARLEREAKPLADSWIAEEARLAETFVPAPRPNTLAVVIGNRNYLEAPEVKFAHNDASAFARYFSEVMGLEAQKIIVENDVSSVGMARLFGRPGGLEGRLHNLARFVDEIYVFYSGHGVPEIQPGGGARGYLLPIDVPPGAPGFGAYALDELISQLESLPVERVTLFIDACFSGLTEGGSLVPNVSGAFGVAVTSPLRQAKVSVLSATAFDRPQLAHWLPDHEHGAFTFLALSGLHGDADRAGDGRITLAKLQRFIDEGLAFRGFDQRPSLVSRGEDDLIMNFSGAVALPRFER